MMHRYEKSGALSGLQRVREMTLNDGHTFVTLDQIRSEFAKILKLIMSVYEDFDITDYSFRLSLRDPKNVKKYSIPPVVLPWGYSPQGNCHCTML